MSNELTNTKWGYIVPANDKNYNPFYDGNWKVVDAKNNLIQLSQCDSKRGDGYYTSSRKSIIIPMSQFQRDFLKVRQQDIIAEEKKAVCEEQIDKCKHPCPMQGTSDKACPVAKAAKRGKAIVMTNDAITKSVNDRKGAWTDKEIDSYLAKEGLRREKCDKNCRSDYTEATDNAKATDYKWEKIDENAPYCSPDNTPAVPFPNERKAFSNERKEFIRGLIDDLFDYVEKAYDRDFFRDFARGYRDHISRKLRG